MKALATLGLLLSLPVSHIAPRPGPQQDWLRVQHARQGGQWYLAATGHAVYCYGPVVIVRDAHSGMRRVATFCKGEKSIVPLRD